ncbi:MAG: RDD family protein [Acidimicrobiaceae bacterium]|nr:RDD family protein [Acidimicrobiaceae bacterium]
MSHLISAPQAEVVVAEPDRRFYAFVVDRLIAWVIYAAAAVGAWVVFFRKDKVLYGVVALAVVVLVVWFVAAMMTGLAGATPGKSVAGLKVVSVRTGRPIGVGAALLRHAVLGVATLPTLGIGAASLAWMATADPTGHRRGWHDRLAHSVVVDVRPRVAEHEEAAEAPRRIINLTAMRLMPAPPEPEPTPMPARRESTFTGSRPTPTPTPAPAPPISGHISIPSPMPMSAPPAPSPAPSGPIPTPSGGIPDRREPPAAAMPPRQAIGGAEQSAGAATQTRWRVTFDTGESFVVSGLALVGRGPEPKPGEQVSHLVALSSTDMSLSKTHAQFQVVPDGTLVVMDRGSTNGTILIRQGAARSLGARKPTTLVPGDRVRFGDREMQVVREA